MCAKVMASIVSCWIQLLIHTLTSTTIELLIDNYIPLLYVNKVTIVTYQMLVYINFVDIKALNALG